MAGAGETQVALDAQNAAFWDELCGSALARRLGIEDTSRESLDRFDAAYMATYPYLDSYLPKERLRGAEVLEIGLGYGTLSDRLISLGARVHGVDIAPGPVEMVRHRLRLAGQDPGERVVQASVLELPHPDESFEFVYSIGCLHHTGDIPGAVGEVHRVLRRGGTAVVMLYNRNSLRQLVKVRLPALLGRRQSDEEVAGLYDTNETGDAAPHVEYVSRREARRIFEPFSKVRIDSRNFDPTRFIPRERLLGNVDRLLGLDLYITSTK